MYSNVQKTYQQANVLTANPIKLVLMCYEGAISNLKLAVKAYEDRQFETKAKALQKSLNFIDELNASLDMEKGGEVAMNLRKLYNYMFRILTEADLKKDTRMFDQVIGMLEELESAWKALAVPNAAESVEEKANQDIISNQIKNRPVGSTTYGSGRTTVAARAWSV
ncbi:MAG: flagellar export chaperone FliS [Deltaproteobacteria bacterium]|nr:flagellar export chaperone FliS [Deltaproteobacteria bacterium]